MITAEQARKRCFMEYNVEFYMGAIEGQIKAACDNYEFSTHLTAGCFSKIQSISDRNYPNTSRVLKNLIQLGYSVEIDINKVIISW